VVFTIEKMLKESGDKMKAEDKTELESKVAELKKAKEGGNLDEMKKKMEELNTVAQRIGAAMYQQPGAEAGAQAGPDQSAGGANSTDKKDDVVEGEVEEKK